MKTLLIAFGLLSSLSSFAQTGWDEQAAMSVVEVVTDEPMADLSLINDCEHLFYGYCLENHTECPYAAHPVVVENSND